MGQLILFYGEESKKKKIAGSLEELSPYLKAHYSAEEVRDLLKKGSLIYL